MNTPQASTMQPPAEDKASIFDVIIAGGGPTGSMLAAELRLHNVRVLVLEKESEPPPFVRIVGLHIRTLELMEMRGLLERILPHGRQRPVGGFFAAIAKPAPTDLDSTCAYLLGIPQPVLNRMLQEHAGKSGALVRSGCAVAGFDQDEDGVTVRLADGEKLRSRYLVGCDGARSTVRKRLGVAFLGEPSRNETLMGELQLGVPPMEIAAKVREVSETEKRFSIRPLGEGGLQCDCSGPGSQRPHHTAHPRRFQTAIARRRRNGFRCALPTLDVPIR